MPRYERPSTAPIPLHVEREPLLDTDVSELAPIRLEGDRLSVGFLPSVGGKISHLVDKRTGRDWLWHNPHLPVVPPRYGASYVQAHDSGGFDECFPAVGEGPFPTEPWKGVLIPDHGELWGLAWEVAPDPGRIRMAVDGVRFPYRFERDAELAAGEAALHLSYRVSNRAPFPFPFIWSSHPLLDIKPGMRLLVPEGTPFRLYGASDPSFGSLGTPITWPDLAGRDLSRLPEEGAGFAVKLFGEAPACGWVGLHDPDTATTLRMEFDPQAITNLGLWLNMGGWAPNGQAPYYNLGLEPCIGAGDDLAIAYHHFRSVGTIPPKGTRTWRLTLRFIQEVLP